MRIGILTDLHFRPPGSPADGWHNPHQFESARQRLTSTLTHLETQGIDQLAVLGDLTHDADDPTFADVLDLLATSSVPIWIVPGNHDLGSDASHLASAIASRPDSLQLLGGALLPLTSIWQVTGFGLSRAAGGYQIDPPPTVPSWGVRPTLVLSHFPLLSLREDAIQAELKYAGDPVNGPEVASDLIGREAPTLVISGHLHIRQASSRGPVLQASCGAQIESLFEVTVLDLSNWETGVVRWHSTSIEPVWPGVVPALSDPIQTWQWTGDGWQSIADASRLPPM